MRRFYRTLTLTGVLAAFTLTAIAPAFAGTTGRKNTAMALSAATVYSFMKKNNRVAIVGALASAQAWKNYEDSRKRDSRLKNQRYYYRPSTYRSSRSYRPKTYRRVSSSRGYSRPAGYGRAGALPAGYTKPVTTSSAQASQLEAKVAKLETQNTELKRQTQVSQLQAENQALKAEMARQQGELGRQKTMVADVRSDASASRLRGLITAIAAVMLIGLAFGVGKLSKIGK